MSNAFKGNCTKIIMLMLFLEISFYGENKTDNVNIVSEKLELCNTAAGGICSCQWVVHG
jgi:hypothetical protein